MAVPGAARTRKAKEMAETACLTKALEARWDTSASRTECLIPQYDATKDPNCRMFAKLQSKSRPGEALLLPNEALYSDGRATSGFEAVAAAFDFKHHDGTDPAAEMRVLKAVLRRETVLSRLEVVAEQLLHRTQRTRNLRGIQGDELTTLAKSEKRVVVDLMTRLREATLDVCEAIAQWRTKSGDAPTRLRPFEWHGRNYLLKVAESDLDFVGEVTPFAMALGAEPEKICRNPLMLPRTLDEAATELPSDDHPPTFPSKGPGNAQSRMSMAERMLVAELQADIKRQQQAAPSSGRSPEFRDDQALGSAPTTHGVPKRRVVSACALRTSDSVPPALGSLSPVSVDAGWGPRKHELVTWFDEAQAQLRRLKRAASNDVDIDQMRRSRPRPHHKLRPIRASHKKSGRSRDRTAQGTTTARKVTTYAGSQDAGLHNPSLKRDEERAQQINPGVAPVNDEDVLAASETWGVLCGDDPCAVGETSPAEDADRKKSKARKKTKKKPTPTSAGSQESVAAEHAAAARKAAAKAANRLTTSDLATLAAVERPSESLGLIGAAIITLCTPGSEVPVDIRWPTFVARVRGSSLTLADIAACEPNIPAFKRQALHRFLTAAPAPSSPTRFAALEERVATVTNRFDAWVRALLSAADASAAADEATRISDKSLVARADALAKESAATAAAAVKQQPRSTSSKAVRPTRTTAKSATRQRIAPKRSADANLLSTTVRDGMSGSCGGDATPWVVTIFELVGNKDAYEVVAYDPLTSREVALRLQTDEAAEASRVDGVDRASEWAREVLPYRVELVTGKNPARLKLKLGDRIAKPRAEHRAFGARKISDVVQSSKHVFGLIRRGRSSLSQLVALLPGELRGYLDSAEFASTCATIVEEYADSKGETTLAALSKHCFTKVHRARERWLAADAQALEALMGQYDGVSGVSLGAADESQDVASLCRFALAASYLREKEVRVLSRAIDNLDTIAPSTLLSQVPEDLFYELQSDTFQDKCLALYRELEADKLAWTELPKVLARIATRKGDIVSAAAIQDLVDALRQRFDTKSITRDELVEFVQVIRTRGYVEAARDSLKKVDTYLDAERVEQLLADLQTGKSQLGPVLERLPSEFVDFVTNDAFLEDAMRQFDALDSDCNGRLTPNELWPVVARLSGAYDGINVKYQHCVRLSTLFDANRDGAIDREEFVEFTQYVIAWHYVHALGTFGDIASADEHPSGSIDGKIRMEQFLKLVAERCINVGSMMKLLPSDVATFLTSEDFERQCISKYQALDVNGDCRLTPEELAPLVVDIARDEEIAQEITLQDCCQLNALFDREAKGFVALGEFTDLCRAVIAASKLREFETADVHSALGLLSNGIQFIDSVFRVIPRGLATFLESPDFRNRCAEKFETLDVNNCNSLSHNELWPIIMELADLRDGMVVTPEHCSRLLELFDADSNGVLDCEEFLSFTRFVFAMRHLESLKLSIDTALSRQQQDEEGNGPAVRPRSTREVLAAIEAGKADVPKLITKLPRHLLHFLVSDEFKNESAARFNHVSPSHDSLSPEQLKPVVAKLAKTHLGVTLDDDASDWLARIFTDARGLVSVDNFVDMSQTIVATSYVLRSENQRLEATTSATRLGRAGLEDVLKQLLPGDTAEFIKSEDFQKRCMERYDQGAEALTSKQLFPIIREIAGSHVVVRPEEFYAITNAFSAGVIRRDEFVSFTALIVGFASLLELKEQLDKIFALPTPVDDEATRVHYMLDRLKQGKQHAHEILAKLDDALTRVLLGDDFIAMCLKEYDDLDSDGNGTLTADELVPVLIRLAADVEGDVTVSEKQGFELVQIFDEDAKGSINRHEFVLFSQFALIFAYLDAKARKFTLETLRVDAIMDAVNKRKLGEALAMLPPLYADFLQSAEFEAECIQNFDGLDANGDGALPADVLYPIMACLVDAWDNIDVTMSHPQYTHIVCLFYGDDENRAISRAEFVRFSQFILVMQLIIQRRSADGDEEVARIDAMRASLMRDKAGLAAVIGQLPAELRGFLTSDEFITKCTSSYAQLGKIRALSPADMLPVITELAGAHNFVVSAAHCSTVADVFGVDASGAVDQAEYVEATQFVIILAYLEHANSQLKTHRTVSFEDDAESGMLEGGVVIIGPGAGSAAAAANGVASPARQASSAVSDKIRSRKLTGMPPLAPRKSQHEREEAAIRLQAQARRKFATAQIKKHRSDFSLAERASTRDDAVPCDDDPAATANGDYEDDYCEEEEEHSDAATGLQTVQHKASAEPTTSDVEPQRLDAHQTDRVEERTDDGARPASVEMPAADDDSYANESEEEAADDDAAMRALSNSEDDEEADGDYGDYDDDFDCESP